MRYRNAYSRPVVGRASIARPHRLASLLAVIGSFYTLQALVREWQPLLEGATLEDAFSQEAGEGVLIFVGPEGRAHSVHVGIERPLLFAFRTDGASKARRNVATLFEPAHGRRLRAVRIARRDRLISFDLDGNHSFRIPLYGARANIFLIEKGTNDDIGRIVDALWNREQHTGQPPPTPQAAPMPDDLAAFEERWNPSRNTLAQAVSSAMTLFGPTLAEETVFRADVKAQVPSDCDERARQRLFKAAQALREELRVPSPRLYAEGWVAGAFSLIELHHRRETDAETFETVDEAARVFMRRSLAEERYEELKKPLEQALTDAVDRLQRTLDSLEGQLKGEPRADRYEHFGHLLKAQPHRVDAGAEEAPLPDLFAEGADTEQVPTVTVPLEPDLSAVENADRYYEKARRARTDRVKAEERLTETRREHRHIQRLLHELREADTLKKLRRFRRERADALSAYTTGREGADTEEVPFRRFRLKNGYEIWAGKNARQNHDLTFHHAQKYDLWLHARKVPGAHVVLRLPNRDAAPDRRIVQAAAGVAAYYSKARASKLVPVMVTRRKYVTSPSGAPPGAVRVEREEVVMAEPNLPQ